MLVGAVFRDVCVCKQIQANLPMQVSPFRDQIFQYKGP